MRQEVALLENDSQHGFLMPSDAYPASRYGPPFDYAPWYTSKDGARGKEVPIAPIRVPQLTVCREVEGSQVCGGQNDTGETLPWYRPLVHDYAVDAKIWKVFGVTPPSDPAPRWAPRDCGRDRQCMAAETVRRQEYETAFAAFQAPYAELDRRIRAFNADYARRMSYRFTIYEVDELVTETRTLTSDPGRILSGGAMTLAGAVTNDKSQIAAGGALVVQGPDIENIGAQAGAPWRSKARPRTPSPAAATSAAAPGRLKPSSARYRTTPWRCRWAPLAAIPPCRSAARRPAPPASPRPAPSWWPASACPAASWSHRLQPGQHSRQPALRRQQPAGRAYIVATDPRFTGQRPYVSSDYLFDLLRPSGGMPGAPTGNSVGAGGTLAGSRLGSWDALIPPGAKFLTPSGQPKRLGDGFYEQKAVSDQILPPPASASWRSTATTTRSTRPCSRPAPSSRRTTASSSASR